MCLATSEDTVRGLLLNSTLQVLRTVRDESLWRRCEQEMGEERFLDFFLYPFRLQGQLVFHALPALAEEYGTVEEALRHLGRSTAMHFVKVGAGKVMMSLSPNNPRALLSTLPTAYRLAVSYGQYVLIWTGQRSGRFLVKGDFMPYPVHEGVVSTVLELAGAREVQVSGRPTGELDSECEFGWQ